MKLLVSDKTITCKAKGGCGRGTSFPCFILLVSAEISESPVLKPLLGKTSELTVTGGGDAAQSAGWVVTLETPVLGTVAEQKFLIPRVLL